RQIVMGDLRIEVDVLLEKGSVSVDLEMHERSVGPRLDLVAHLVAARLLLGTHELERVEHSLDRLANGRGQIPGLDRQIFREEPPVLGDPKLESLAVIVRVAGPPSPHLPNGAPAVAAELDRHRARAFELTLDRLTDGLGNRADRHMLGDALTTARLDVAPDDATGAGGVHLGAIA